MALRVTLVFAGNVAGPVKVVGAPLAVVAGLTVPQPGEQTVPFCVSVQLKPWLLASLPIVAVNCCVALMGMIPLGGEITGTVIAGTVTVAEDDFVVSVADVAVTFTVRSLGGGWGAVYVVATALAVDVGETVPQGAGEQDTLQVTPPLVRSLPTVAVNCWVVFASTVGDCGSVSTVMAGTVMVAEAMARELATEVAVSVTCKSFAGGGGAA
jgi:hypothetical protein